MPSTATSSLVPARRLGQLLMEHRTTSKTSQTKVANRSTFLATPKRVAQLESGLLALTDVEVEEVVDAYGVSLSTLVPQRTQLALDLETLSLSFGRRQVTFARSEDATLDELLSHYLSTVRALRSLPDKAEISLREADLRTLSTGLVLPIEDVRVRLHMLMDDRPDELRERAELILGRPLIPALGIMVGGTGIGSLILAPPAPGGTDRRAPRRRASDQVDDGDGEKAADGFGDIEDVKQAALELISYDYNRFLPQWDIEFWPAQSERRGKTIKEERLIEVYVHEDQRPEDLAHAVAYELGRAVDAVYNDGRQRLNWLEMRGIGGQCPWLNGDGADDPTVGAGDFADSFAHWQSGGRMSTSQLAGPPTGEQLNLLSELSFGQAT